MKKWRLKILLIILFIVLVSAERIDNGFDKICEKWKNDKCGCFKNRNFKNALAINNFFENKNVQKSYLFEKIGYPDSIFVDTHDSCAVYFFDSRCENGVLIDSIDYCWLSFNINSGIITKISIACY